MPDMEKPGEVHPDVGQFLQQQRERERLVNDLRGVSDLLMPLSRVSELSRMRGTITQREPDRPAYDIDELRARDRELDREWRRNNQVVTELPYVMELRSVSNWAVPNGPLAPSEYLGYKVSKAYQADREVRHASTLGHVYEGARLTSVRHQTTHVPAMPPAFVQQWHEPAYVRHGSAVFNPPPEIFGPPEPVRSTFEAFANELDRYPTRVPFVLPRNPMVPSSYHGREALPPLTPDVVPPVVEFERRVQDGALPVAMPPKEDIRIPSISVGAPGGPTAISRLSTSAGVFPELVTRSSVRNGVVYYGETTKRSRRSRRRRSRRHRRR